MKLTTAGFRCDAGGKPKTMETWTKRIRAGAQAPGSARSAVRRRLSGELREPRLADVELLVSELATNSIRHGRCDRDGQVTVQAAVTDEYVRLRLCDEGDGFEQRTPKPRTDGSGGYGLFLLDQLADRWGVQRNGSFCVWFEIQR